MKAGTAVGIAKAWVDQEAMQLDGFRAAHLSGSLIALADDDELPDYSDIDVYCIMDDGHGFPQRKFHHRGAFLETVSQPLSAYRSPEAVLSNPFLAHNFLENCILADSEGILESIHRSVRMEFARPQWLRARYDHLKSMALEAVADAVGAESLNTGFPSLFRSLRLLSNLILVAHLRAPTVRKSLPNAGKLLSEGGHASLKEELLQLLGAAHFTEASVLSRLSESAAAFDRAVEVYRTPVGAGFNLDPSVRPYLTEGSMEMIRSGDHREAMLWISAMHWIANQALQNDAPTEEKARWQDSIDRLYADLGLKDMKDYSQRFDEANEVAGTVIVLTDAFVHSREGMSGAALIPGGENPS